MIEEFTDKRAGATKDIGWDWSEWLAGAVNAGDTIANVTHSADGVQIDGNPAGVHDDTRTAVRIKGGTAGTTATVTTTITTSSGEVEIGVHHVKIK